MTTADTVPQPGPRPRRRGAAASAPVELVRRDFLADDFVLRVQAAVPALDLAAWIAGGRQAVLDDLDRYGAVLFRGFDVPGADAFGKAARALSPELLDYMERAAPRTEVGDRIFNSTEFNQTQWIPLHHEMSYSHQWPGRIYFYCDVPAEDGGATPLASEREVYRRIPADIRERFTRHGVQYVRNYGPDIDLPWQEVFQTTSRDQVESYCRETATEFTWIGRDGLRTRAVRQATARHPRTGETVWFNHAHLFHMSNMPEDISATLLETHGTEGLPRNAYYGDGEPIETEVVAEIRRLYADHSIRFPWQRGDVLAVDNFLATHGREPFTGDRRILVAMSDLYVNTEMIRGTK